MAIERIITASHGAMVGLASGRGASLRFLAVLAVCILASMNGQALLELVKRFLPRAVAGNFQRERASDQERQQLAAANPPIADPLAQDYMAWRRAALWVGGVLLTIGAGIACAEHQSVAEQIAEANAEAAGQPLSGAELAQATQLVASKFGEDNVAIIDGLTEFLLFVKVSVAALAVAAAWQWVRVKRSRSLARWGWLVALVLPLAVSAWPWSQSLDFSHLDQQGFGAQQSAVAKQQIGLAIAAVLMATITPKLIALFPGIMRSSLALKTLLPQAAAPGWLAVVFAPFLVGFLMLVLCFLSQVQGSWLLLGAVVAFCNAPILYVRRAADLVRPHTEAEVGLVLASVRRLASLTNLIGAGLLITYLFMLESLPWTTTVHILLDAAGGILLSMVAISDITLALLALSQRQGAQFQSSELRPAYEQRLQSLASAGLTDVESALGVKDLENLRNIGKV